MSLCQTLLVGLGLSLVSATPFLSELTKAKLAPQPADEQAVATACVATLTWTADTQGWTGGTRDGGIQAAANHVEQGFTDWRLPTVQELQNAITISYGQPGSWGQDSRNPGGITSAWTSKSQGIWAWRVKVATDSNGFVDPSQGGESSKVLKGSNFARTKFVRP